MASIEPFQGQIDAIELDSEISTERSKVIRSLVRNLAAKASRTALVRADRNCLSIRVFNSPAALQIHLFSLGDPYTRRPAILQYVYGVYERNTKSLLLADFATDAHDYEQYLAQEFAHAIDGPEFELSQSALWSRALPKIKESPHFDSRQAQLPFESFAQALVLGYTEGYDFAAFVADDLASVGEALRSWG